MKDFPNFEHQSRSAVDMAAPSRNGSREQLDEVIRFFEILGEVENLDNQWELRANLES